MHSSPQDEGGKKPQRHFPHLDTKGASLLAMAALCVGVPVLAQSPEVSASVPANVPAENKQESNDGEELDANQASIRTRKDARTMSLAIPAPRGQITDRFGYSFAQNAVVYYPALQMKQFKDESDKFVLQWARERLAKANEVFGLEIAVTDEEIIEHYKHRRWLPMPFKHAVVSAAREKTEAKLMDGLILHPIYQRVYPHKDSSSHIIGYVGSKSKDLEIGPINYGDPLFWEMQGRGGLEKQFNDVLTGKNGMRKLQYNSTGKEVRRKDISPQPGGTVVTTLDMEWQLHAEKVLAKLCKRGAFVVIDIETGEVLVLASRPSYDLNLSVPYLKQEDLDKLLKDPSKPLYGRAFQGGYPPASAFKVVTGLAALQSGALTKDSGIYCPAFIQLGKIKMYDWSRKPRGSMSIVPATTLSNNPFFIQAAIACERKKKGEFMSLASRLGYGAKTGLPLEGENPGTLLSEEYAQQRFGRRISDGDIANASIGQGAILASPLQVAQSMAAIGNGGFLPKLHLIKQLQNSKGVITMASKPTERNQLKISPEAIQAIQEGMYSVVNSPGGTGRATKLSFSVLCGKTGTAQWGPKNKQQRLAWFAGFFPLEKPKYAFAALYEGSPNEKVSGGRSAGPIAHSFFEHFKDQAFVRHQLSQKALIIPDDSPATLDAPLSPGKAILVDEIELPDDENLDELPIETPRALIVEDDEEIDPALPEEPEGPIDPTETTDPEDPATEITPPKAIPIEDEPEDLQPEIPDSSDPAEEPTEEPTTEPETPRAVPVE